MTDLDLDRIEAAARAVVRGDSWWEADDIASPDGEYIALMDPATTLALVARLREAEYRLAAQVGLYRSAEIDLRDAEARLAAVDTRHRSESGGVGHRRLRAIERPHSIDTTRRAARAALRGLEDQR